MTEKYKCLQYCMYMNGWGFIVISEIIISPQDEGIKNKRNMNELAHNLRLFFSKELTDLF